MSGSWRQTRVPMSILRGGTSRGIFFHEKDIPKPGPLRDQFLKRVMGTPDPSQIDGLGGSHTVTSKVAIIKRSERPNVDVDYTFAQVGTADDTVIYDANCGNVSSAVGPFAIDEGLVKEYRKGREAMGVSTQLVHIFNTGTQKMMYEHVPVEFPGQTQFEGDFKIAGVPGTGAPILIDWKETIGAKFNKGVLPTGNAIDQVNIQGQDIPVTICDVANFCVFVKASDLGLKGNETKQEIDGGSIKGLDSKLRELRSKVAEKVGLTDDWHKLVNETPFTPFIVIVSQPEQSADVADIQARLILRNKCHPTLAGSGTICTGACSQIPGSIVNQVLQESNKTQPPSSSTPLELRISHPKGVIPVWVDVKLGNKASDTTYEVLAISRTARRILDGYVYVPKSVWDGHS